MNVNHDFKKLQIKAKLQLKYVFVSLHNNE